MGHFGPLLSFLLPSLAPTDALPSPLPAAPPRAGGIDWRLR